MRQLLAVRRSFVLATACGIATIGLCFQVQATPLEALTSPNNSILDTGADYSVGYEFLVGSLPLRVTSLGIWDPTSPAGEGFGGSGTGAGFAVSHDVAIWTTAGSLVASATVPALTTAGETSNGYLFAANNLGQATLAANTDYVIAFNKNGSDENHSQFGSGPVFNTPYVALVSGEYTTNSPSGTLTFPTIAGGIHPWDPNFQFIPAPEPSSALLGGLAALGLIAARLRLAVLARLRLTGRIALLCAIVALVGYCSAANATAITVANPGFDDILDQSLTDSNGLHAAGTDVPQNYYARFSTGPTNPTTVYYENSSTGGTPDVPVGVTATLNGWTPGAIYMYTGMQNPGEINVGNVGELTSVGGSAASLSQTLPGPVTFSPNTTYTLTVDLYNKGVVPNPGFDAELTAAGAPLGLTQTTANPTLGSSTPDIYTVTYTTGAVAPVGAIGISLSAFNINSGDFIEQILVDNVTLQTVPEPSSVVLCALGTAALIAVRLRRKAGRKG